MYVFSGTGVASWPDKTWVNELNELGLDETRINERSHFFEKIMRAHRLSKQLGENRDVLIDSDPLHKTLMHEIIRENSFDISDFQDRFQKLIDLANLEDNHIHIHMRVSDKMTPQQQAQILQDRIKGRGELAPFDPETIGASVAMVKACETIALLLMSSGNKVISLNSVDNLGFDELWTLIKKS